MIRLVLLNRHEIITMDEPGERAINRRTRLLRHSKDRTRRRARVPL